MYDVVNNDIPAQLTAAITAEQTFIPLDKVSTLPPAPNLVTLSFEDTAEVVLYEEIDGNSLIRCIRGYGGTLKQPWEAATQVYRAYTVTDHRRFKENIEALDAEKLDLSGDGSGVTVAFTEAGDNALPVSGETQGTLWGRVLRWLGRLKEGAFAAFGTGASDIARGNHNHDAAYAAIAHAARHASGGADPVTPGAIGAVPQMTTNPTWVAPTLASGYTNVNGLTKCMKDTAGWVNLIMAVAKDSQPANSETVMTIPAGYRPSVTSLVAGVCESGAAAGVSFWQMYIQPTGVVNFTGAGAPPSYQAGKVMVVNVAYKAAI